MDNYDVNEQKVSLMYRRQSSLPEKTLDQYIVNKNQQFHNYGSIGAGPSTANLHKSIDSIKLHSLAETYEEE